MKEHKSDCIVMGAGIIGLAAALLASQKGLSVNVVDLKSAPVWNASWHHQVRTIALNQATLAMLDLCKVWKFIDKSRLGFMDSMHIVDAQGSAFTIEGHRKDESISIVIEYAHLEWALYQTCLKSSFIHFYFDHSFESLFLEDHQVSLKINPDTYLEAKVVVGADGADSSLARYLNFSVKKRDYHHTACIGLASSEKGLHHQALQTCGEGFILGILPLSDSHCHSIVFSCDDAKKTELLQSDQTMQDCLLTNASQHQLGFMQWQTPIVSIPLIRQHLETYVSHRVVMIGDAAHRIHPLAGQGANMGFSDVMALMDRFESSKKNHHDLGSLRVLKQFELKQKSKNNLFLMMHDVLKEGLTHSSMHWSLARQFAFQLFDKNPLLEQVLKKISG